MFEQLVVGGKVELFKKSRRIKENGELKSFTSDEITLDITLHVGKELILNKVTIIDWEEQPETEL